jgi:hypothetical protein
MFKNSKIRLFNKFSSILLTLFFLYLNSCGLYKPVDARKIPPSAEARVKLNQEEGKGFTLGGSKKIAVFFSLLVQMQCGELQLIF